MKNKSKNKIISLILALGCFLSGYSYIDNSLTVYASGEEVDASKIVGALNEEIEKDSQLRCCNCGEIIGENGLELAEGEFLGKSITDLCKECWGSKAYEYLRESQKGNKLDFNDLAIEKNKNCNLGKNIGMHVHERNSRYEKEGQSDYIFRIDKNIPQVRYMNENFKFTEDQNDVRYDIVEDVWEKLIYSNNSIKKGMNDIKFNFNYNINIYNNKTNEVAISGKIRFIEKEINQHQKKYIIQLAYNRQENLTLDGKWIYWEGDVVIEENNLKMDGSWNIDDNNNIKLCEDVHYSYEDIYQSLNDYLMKKSHFSVPNLDEKYIEEKRRSIGARLSETIKGDFIAMYKNLDKREKAYMLNSLEDFVKEDKGKINNKNEKKKLNLNFSSEDKEYDISIKQNEISRQKIEYIDKDGEWKRYMIRKYNYDTYKYVIEILMNLIVSYNEGR